MVKRKHIVDKDAKFIQLDEVFPSPIFVYKMGWDTSFFYEKCKLLRNQIKSVEVSNVGGWQSPPIFNHDFIFDYDHIKHLNKVINNCSKHIGLSNLEISSYWININGFKDCNFTHDHPKSILSGTYYVKTPKNCGMIEFQHPMMNIIQREWDHANVNFNRFTSSRWKYPAVEDTLILFPSWLKHHVLSNLSAEERVSISFNSMCIK